MWKVDGSHREYLVVLSTSEVALEKSLFHQVMQLILMDTLLLITHVQHFAQLCTFILLLGIQFSEDLT